MTTAKRLIDPRLIVESWNNRVRVGDPVIYRDEFGKEHKSRTRSEAGVLSGHTAVVWIEGRAGCVALDRVRAVVEAERKTGAGR
jgi:hypothetical protein